MNRIDAALEGNIFDLFDVHIVPENPTGNKIFEYEIWIISDISKSTLNEVESRLKEYIKCVLI